MSPDEFEIHEAHAVERALDFQIWNLLDDLEGSLSALRKLDEKAASRAKTDIIDKVAGFFSDGEA